jgi:hypothetical protein
MDKYVVIVVCNSKELFAVYDCILDFKIYDSILDAEKAVKLAKKEDKLNKVPNKYGYIVEFVRQ